MVISGICTIMDHLMNENFSHVEASRDTRERERERGVEREREKERACRKDNWITSNGGFI